MLGLSYSYVLSLKNKENLGIKLFVSLFLGRKPFPLKQLLGPQSVPDAKAEII